MINYFITLHRSNNNLQLLVYQTQIDFLETQGNLFLVTLMKHNCRKSKKKKGQGNSLTKDEFVGDKKVTEEMFRKSDTLQGLKRNFNAIMSCQVKNHVLVM